jgi:hypothetical protein
LNVSNVASISSTGAPAAGHQPTVVTGSFLASHLAMRAPSATRR